MRQLTVAASLLLTLVLLGTGCGRRPAADPDARVRAEITRYGVPETVARAREAVQATPSAETYDHLGRALLAGRQNKPARQAFEKALSLDPSYGPSAVILAKALLQEKKAAVAEQMMRTVLAKHSDDLAAHEVLARALTSQGRPSDALTDLQTVIKRHPRAGELLWAKADAEALVNNQEQALKDYQQAIRLLPKVAGVRMSYAETLRRLGRHEEAGKVALQIVELEPNNAELRFMAATVLHQGGQLDAALAQYKEALVINPGAVQAANNLALLLADRRQDTGTAVAWARKAVQLKPDAPEIADTLGWALVRDGQYEAGLGVLRQVNKLWPGHAPVWYHLGWALMQVGQKAEGRRWLEQAAASRDPVAADARKALQTAGS